MAVMTASTYPGEAYVIRERKRPTTAAARLRQLRRERGLTQKELAFAAGVNSKALQSFETGVSQRPSADFMDRLARALGVDPHYLLTGYESPDPELMVPLPRDRAGILKRFARFSRRQLEMLERMGDAAFFERHSENEQTEQDTGTKHDESEGENR